VKQLGAGALDGWSSAGPVLVACVAGRTNARVACCSTGQLVAVMRGLLGRERSCGRQDMRSCWMRVVWLGVESADHGVECWAG
jgi:hypothetical protein